MPAVLSDSAHGYDPNPSTHMLGYDCGALRALRLSLSRLSVTLTTVWHLLRRDTLHMAHSYSSILFHIVFATKERRALIHEPAKLWAYVAGTARKLGYEALAVGGTENHLHLLLRLPAHIAVAEAAQKLKANSSRWLKENGSWLGWQQGYGAFSVSPSNVDAVRRYVQNQPEHHRRRSFEEELLALLMRSGIAFEK